jgi:KTSC domain
MQTVDSSFIHAIDHDPKTNTLIVLLKAGKLYTFHGVSAAIHAEMLAAKSVGSYFATKIKPTFRSTEIAT